MFKRCISWAILMTLFWSSAVFAAEKGVNLYAYPRKLPESTIEDQYGQKYKLSAFRDDFVIAVFWSRDCLPCIRELKSLNGFHHKIRDRKMRLLLISPQADWRSAEEQKKFLRRFGAPDVDFYTDKKGQVAADLGIFTTPHAVLINEDGEEIGRIRGSAKWDDDRVVEYILDIKKQQRKPD